MGLASSLASVIGVGDTAVPVTAGIAEFDGSTYQEVDGSLQAFQYFPETINDTKAADWVRKNVPGGSHPILSFINGGERMITFTAVFTQEENPEELSLVSSLLTGKFELFKGSKRKDTEKNISSAVSYLRAFTYPEYKQGVSKAPPFAIVYLPNSGIVSQQGFEDSIVGAMIQCDVTYEKFHRNGSPRFVSMQLSFVEVVQTSANWKFVGRDDLKAMTKGREYKRAMVGVKKSAGISTPALPGGLKL
jgi:hypothetical protein